MARAVGDAAFRQLLRTNPTAALREFRLTPDERAALTSGDPAKLVSLGIDQRMSRLVVVPDHEVGAFRTAGESDVTAAAGVDIDAGASGGASAIEVTPGGSLNELGLRLGEGRLDTLGGPEIHAGDSLPADYGRVAAEGGAPSHLARIEGDLAGEAPSAVEAELSGHAIEAGFVTPSDTVGGLFRLREGADAVAGDATPAGTAPFRTDILPDHEAAPSAVEGPTESTAIDLSTIDPSLMTPYAPEPGTYVESDTFEVAARHLEAVETGNVGAVEEPEHIEGLHRMREIEGNEQLDVDTTTEGGDQIPEYTEGQEGITE